MSRRGGSKAAARATDLLGRAEVRAHASPALKITMELRDAPCAGKEELLDRAVADGDQRTLMAMNALRSPTCNPATEGCCMRENEKMEQSVRQLGTRLRPGPAPKPAGAVDPY